MFYQLHKMDGNKKICVTMGTTVAVVLALCSSIQKALGSLPGETNLAFRKPASQCSTSFGFLGLASNAVDGSTSASLSEGSCTHTAQKIGTLWWMVDLQDIYTIRSLRITNRNDCCNLYLRNITVEVSTKHPFTLAGFPRRTTADACITIHEHVPSIASFPYECDLPVTGRYMRVVQDNSASSYLSICEFEVYENEIIVKHPVPETPNLALRKPAEQSSTRTSVPGEGRADRAVDGETNGRLEKGSCTHTYDGDLHWWMVDLEDIYPVQTIRITNRYDCCYERLANFVIEVSEEDPSSLEGFPGTTIASVCVTAIDPVPVPVPVNYECHEPVRGRYVRLIKKNLGLDRSPLALCEFEVYGPRSLITTEPPKKFEQGENGLWVFEHVKSHGFQHTHTSMSEQRYLTDCARQRLKEKNNLMASPYIQIDLPAGTCRFLENIADSNISTSLKWSVYQLIRN